MARIHPPQRSRRTLPAFAVSMLRRRKIASKGRGAGLPRLGRCLARPLEHKQGPADGEGLR